MFAFARQHARALAFGALHAFYSAPGQTLCIGLFVTSFGADFGLDPAAVGALYLGATLASAATLLFVGHWNSAPGIMATVIGSTTPSLTTVDLPSADVQSPPA